MGLTHGTLACCTNGVQPSAAARRRWPALPIVVMSGDIADAQHDPDWPQHTVALQKPCTREELAAAITTAFANSADVARHHS